MKNDSKALRNIALGIWLDKRFGTWFTVPLLFIGMAAGARNAYVLAMDTIRQEKLKKDKAQQDEIDRKVEEYRKRQEKDSSEIKR